MQRIAFKIIILDVTIEMCNSYDNPLALVKNMPSPLCTLEDLVDAIL